jgi:hypothetical protein
MAFIRINFGQFHLKISCWRTVLLAAGNFSKEQLLLLMIATGEDEEKK